MLTDDEIRTAFDALLPRRTAGMRTSAMGAGSDDLEAGRAYLASAAGGRLGRTSLGRRRTAAGTRRGPRRRPSPASPASTPCPTCTSTPWVSAWSGPCLQIHGTTEQQDRWLRSIADGSEIWCQMFSEPEAGSDLANVGTRAERDGDEWVFTGQKVWTSRGMWARWGLCLARTDPEVPKHAGLTMFVIDMQGPGVEVRPLAQMNGDQHFSEVFVSEARMPDDARIGGVGEGWKVAMTVLAHERASAGGGRRRGESVARAASPAGWRRSPQPAAWRRVHAPGPGHQGPVPRRGGAARARPGRRPRRPPAGPGPVARGPSCARWRSTAVRPT